MPYCWFEMAAGEVDGRFDDGVGQVGDLPDDGFDRLVADDVAVGDAQRFAAFESAERREHFGVVADARELR